jgi:hypothetical protein
MLSFETRERLFHEKKWAAPAPPVCTARWTIYSWVHWIDTRGCWLPSFDPDRPQKDKIIEIH